MHRLVRIAGYLCFVIGAFWLFLAAWFIWAGGVWEWDPLGFAFAFWFTVFAIPFLILGWIVLRLKP
jgi:hypothetical protein